MGWDNGQIPDLIKGSFLVILAVNEQNQAVGMGRLISDGASDGYIQDIVVFPEYRNARIGSRIVEALRSLAALYGHTWTGLISAPGKQQFYERAHFSAMKDYTPMLFEEK